MIAQLEITYEDGSIQTIISDNSWKYMESQARTGKYIFGYTTQFSEDINLNLWEDNWCEPLYDFSHWQNANVAGVPYPLHYTMRPQPTPPVKHEKIYPVDEYDMIVVCGYTRMRNVLREYVNSLNQNFGSVGLK